MDAIFKLYKQPAMRIIMFLLLFVYFLSPLFGQTKRAFIVGISDYEQHKDMETWSSIHGSNDAEMLCPTLNSIGFKITKLCNKEATADKIRKGIALLIKQCKEGDIVYLHFSCHGQPFEDIDGDEEDGWDESIVPFDAQMSYSPGKYEGLNHIIDDELHSYFQKIRKAVGSYGFLCVVIDACHSGGSVRGEENDAEIYYLRGTKKGFSYNAKSYRPRINATGNFSIPKSSGLSNITILEACRSYQSNYEINHDTQYYGPLSYYVNKVLLMNTDITSLEWAMTVKKMMDSDRRLIRQNMVYETSLE